jgi:hypothetical protein
VPGAAIVSYDFALSQANTDADPDALTDADTHAHTDADTHAHTDPKWYLSVGYRLSHRDRCLPDRLVTCGQPERRPDQADLGPAFADQLAASVSHVLAVRQALAVSHVLAVRQALAVSHVLAVRQALAVRLPLCVNVGFAVALPGLGFRDRHHAWRLRRLKPEP